MMSAKQVVLEDIKQTAIQEAMDAIVGQIETAEDLREMTEGEGHNGYLSLQELLDNLEPIGYTSANIVIGLGRLVEANQVEAVDLCSFGVTDTNHCVFAFPE